MFKNRNCVITAWQIAESKVVGENFTKESGLSGLSGLSVLPRMATAFLVWLIRLPTTKIPQCVTILKQLNTRLPQLTREQLHIHLS